MGNYKWNINNSNKDLPYVVVLFRSRNKDNTKIEGFKERKQAFFRTRDIDKITRDFKRFAEDGIPGEMSRCYISLNARDVNKVKKALLHMLIDEDSICFDYIESKIAGIAAKKENAAEKKWFFDFDSTDTNEYLEFIKDLTMEYGDTPEAIYPTPHGKAIVVSHGFDTRKLMEKWGHIVGLKRDDLICRFWSVREE